MKKSNNNHTQSVHNPWIMLILCYFLGIFGVHKFVEKRVGIGFLYLFTGGLCGVGWLVDCIRYLVAGFTNKQSDASSDTVASMDPTQLSAPITTHSVSIKTIAVWIGISITAFIALGAFASNALLSGISLVILIALLLPIPKWQLLLAKFIKKKLKAVLAVVFSVLFVCGITTVDQTPPTSINPTSTVTFTTTTSTAGTTITTANTTTSSPTTSTASTTANATTSSPSTTAITTMTIATTQKTTVSTTTTTVHIHDFSTADCTTPKTCTCGAKEGSELGHSWEDATCLSPKKCSRCGVESGNLTDHSYSDGTCLVCGGSDPDYSSGNLVWIPTNGGKKYHSHSGCSNMDNPRQVTKEEAEALGFEPCKKCH